MTLWKTAGGIPRRHLPLRSRWPTAVLLRETSTTIAMVGMLGRWAPFREDPPHQRDCKP